MLRYPSAEQGLRLGIITLLMGICLALGGCQQQPTTDGSQHPTASSQYNAPPSITEFKVSPFGSQPMGITAGPDGNLWFADFGHNQIGRITPAGIVTEFDVHTAKNGATDGIEDITAGPDGNLLLSRMATGSGASPQRGRLPNMPCQWLRVVL